MHNIMATEKFWMVSFDGGVKCRRNSYAIYQMLPSSVTLNDPNLYFKSMPLFDIEHLYEKYKIEA